MTDANIANSLFFENSEMDRSTVERQVSDALKGADDGELFLEYRQSEAFSFDDGRLKSASFDTTQGFGLRAVCGEATGFAHASELSDRAVENAADTVRAVTSGKSGSIALPPAGVNRSLYSDENPISDIPFETKVKTLAEIDAYARAKDSRVVQVSASLAGSWQVVEIIRSGAERSCDIRPLVRLNVSVVVEKDGRRESGSHGTGGRTGYDFYLQEDTWKSAVDEALRQAVVNLDSVDAPAGEMEVIVGPGWPGIILHEAVGHGLEGDFNRKKTSVFSDLIGERVAAPGVTVVDDGTIPDRRGSLTVDDEGTASSCTTLIEDGILVGYMQDRQNARLMGVDPTGNGRRESYSHLPMPRMTNTYMLGGDRDPDEILGSVKKGLYAINFGGGQVDITSGKFVFSCTEAYMIEDGKLTAPVKGATLIGTGSEALKKVKAVGNDMALDSGIGTCGKAGQSVPVGVGQPTMLLEGLTVGGTAS
ncbi:metalloprotease TldD [Sneathiella sp. P13V-1]|uniref:metalloprotease TldD n=1 Tax=Sneathiella sp. P13V-1 TaxID=2697366 RepID=UPI00187B69EC|nr:metalloprotease TldD [Sneathiella sp. P13V-1]